MLSPFDALRADFAKHLAKPESHQAGTSSGGASSGWAQILRPRQDDNA